MLALRGKPVTACYAILTSLPPAGCGGVEVTNVNLTDIPGLTVYANGTQETPVERLVGIWDGQTFRLTQPPSRSSQDSTSPLPVAEPPSTDAKAAVGDPTQIARDGAKLRRQGILVLSVGVGADGVDVLLAVADSHSVQAMYASYGSVHISGWLQPA